jgi:ribosome-binding protein aMBF1 (putative translation factor)
MANLNTLKAIAKDDKALEKIKDRINNRIWLKYSQKVALIVLNEIELKDISQKELALKMEVSPQYINKLVKGKEKLNIETISKLESALNINILTISEPRKLEPKGRVVNVDFSVDLSLDQFSTPHTAKG